MGRRGDWEIQVVSAEVMPYSVSFRGHPSVDGDLEEKPVMSSPAPAAENSEQSYLPGCKRHADDAQGEPWQLSLGIAIGDNQRTASGGSTDFFAPCRGP